MREDAAQRVCAQDAEGQAGGDGFTIAGLLFRR
jgi:hypothetical protein